MSIDCCAACPQLSCEPRHLLPGLFSTVTLVTGGLPQSKLRDAAPRLDDWAIGLCSTAAGVDLFPRGAIHVVDGMQCPGRAHGQPRFPSNGPACGSAKVACSNKISAGFLGCPSTGVPQPKGPERPDIDAWARSDEPGTSVGKQKASFNLSVLQIVALSVELQDENAVYSETFLCQRHFLESVSVGLHVLCSCLNPRQSTTRRARN